MIFYLMARVKFSRAHLQVIKRDKTIWNFLRKPNFAWNSNHKFWSKFWNLKIWIFGLLPNFNICYLFEFWRYDNDPIIKKHLFLSKFSDLRFFFGARALPPALRAMISAPKISFWIIFSSTGCCAHIWRAPSDRTSSKQHFMYLQHVHIC